MDSGEFNGFKRVVQRDSEVIPCNSNIHSKSIDGFEGYVNKLRGSTRIVQRIDWHICYKWEPTSLVCSFPSLELPLVQSCIQAEVQGRVPLEALNG